MSSFVSTWVAGCRCRFTTSSTTVIRVYSYTLGSNHVHKCYSFHTHTVPLPDILLSSSLYLSGFCFQRNLEVNYWKLLNMTLNMKTTYFTGLYLHALSIIAWFILASFVLNVFWNCVSKATWVSFIDKGN